MRDEDFLRAILVAPEEVELRLAYADRLEECGDPRHEVIRACETMRRVPVWSNRYWELKARRNELWPTCPVGWLEATGYDGSRYDPVFRDGVPDGWRERWRLIREFTERWHGVAVPDACGGRGEVSSAENRLGLALPPSVREFVAYAHDLGDAGTAGYGRRGRVGSLFHCANYHLDLLDGRDVLGVIFFSLDGGSLGVRLADLRSADPPAVYVGGYESDFEIGDAGVAREVLMPGAVSAHGPALTQSIFRCLFTELHVAGSMVAGAPADLDALLRRLAADFPVRARFDDAEVFEGDEMLVLVSTGSGGGLGAVKAVLRRPVPVESIPGYLFGTDEGGEISSGLLGPLWFRRQQEEERGRPDFTPPAAWVSIPRRSVPTV